MHDMDVRARSGNGVAGTRVAKRGRRGVHREEGTEVMLWSTLVQAEAYRSDDAAWRKCGSKNGEDGGSAWGLFMDARGEGEWWSGEARGEQRDGEDVASGALRRREVSWWPARC